MGARFSAIQKQQSLDLVHKTKQRSQWPLEWILACLGVSRSVYFAWRARAHRGQLEDRPRCPQSYDRLMPDEVEALKAFAWSHPKVGYRKLSYMMPDQDVAAVSERAPYRVLREAD